MKRKETELLNDNVVKKNEQKISFEISGDDYIKFKAFVRTHKRCIDNYPDVSGAQYEFSFIPSGLGVFKTVTCSCGETLLLHSDIFGEVKKELNQCVKTKEYSVGRDEVKAATEKLLERLESIRKRPGLFLGRKSGELLNVWIAGVVSGERLNHFDEHSLDRINRARLKWQKLTEVKVLDDEASFDLFFEILNEKKE